MVPIAHCIALRPYSLIDFLYFSLYIYDLKMSLNTVTIFCLTVSIGKVIKTITCNTVMTHLSSIVSLYNKVTTILGIL